MLVSVATLSLDDLLDVSVSIFLSNAECRHPLPSRVEIQELAGQQSRHTEPEAFRWALGR